MYDPDFPPPSAPPDLVPPAEATKDIIPGDYMDQMDASRKAYEASPEFAAVKVCHIVTSVFERLDRLATHDSQAVTWACYDWLSLHEAGTPAFDALDGNVRDAARFWAETATPHELECYAFAAVDRLNGMSGGHALFASRQIKRLAAGLFRRMSPDERSAFKTWMESVND